MQMKSIIGCSLALAAVFISGCATTRSFKVDAISASTPVESRTYHIVPANPQIPDNDLRFIEAAGVVENALSARGYTRRAESQSADLVIAMESSVGQPETITVSRPSVETADFGFYRSVRVPIRNRNGRISFVRTMVWTPDYGYIETDHVSTTTVYEKRLALTAFANNGAEDLPQLWSVVVVERDESSDIRSLMPMMAVTAVKYIEKDTKGQVVTRLEMKDPEVLRISPAKDGAK